MYTKNVIFFMFIKAKVVVEYQDLGTQTEAGA